jgi:hypothetical protein
MNHVIIIQSTSHFLYHNAAQTMPIIADKYRFFIDSIIVPQRPPQCSIIIIIVSDLSNIQKSSPQQQTHAGEQFHYRHLLAFLSDNMRNFLRRARHGRACSKSEQIYGHNFRERQTNVCGACVEFSLSFFRYSCR